MFIPTAVALARETGQQIIGGTNANIANYPYQLSLRTSAHICGASLISATRAVTAAHCIGLAALVYGSHVYNKLLNCMSRLGQLIR